MGSGRCAGPEPGYDFKAMSCTPSYLNPQICQLSLLKRMYKENLYAKMEKLEA